MPTANAINQQIAEVFYGKERALSAKGEKYKFRALAYRRAAQAIENLDQGLDRIYQHSWLTGLEKVEGIGNRLAHEIEHELKKMGIRR